MLTDERQSVAPPSHRVLLVAPAPPPYGGMSIQARMFEQALREDGISVVSFASNLSLPQRLRLLNRIPGIRTIIRTALIWTRLGIKVRNTDVVHVFATNWVYFFAVVVPCVVYGRLYRKRIMLNYHGGNAKEFFCRWGWAIKPVFRSADVVTSPSRFLGDLIQTHFSVPVLIVPNILDLSVFTYRSRRVFEPKLLVTRHLEQIYDVETVLKAFREVQSHYPDASLWVAGTGSQEQYLRGLVSAWNLKNVQFLGYVPHSELSAIYDQCDILLNASRVDNFPGALLEASAAGLVVVSTAAGGIPVVYKNGESALLADLGDWRELARLVGKVLESAPLASALSERAAALVKQCDWKEVRKSLYRGYGFGAEELERPPAMDASAVNAYEPPCPGLQEGLEKAS